jgi:hypothetical protein
MITIQIIIILDYTESTNGRHCCLIDIIYYLGGKSSGSDMCLYLDTIHRLFIYIRYVLTIPGLSFPYDNKKTQMNHIEYQWCLQNSNNALGNVIYYAIMFDTSIPPVVCRRAHVLLTLFIFVSAQWCPTYIVMCFWFFFLRLYCQRERERERERESVCLYVLEMMFAYPIVCHN